jgi:hypothetical protein
MHIDDIGAPPAMAIVIMNDYAAKLSTAHAAVAFALAGKARLTLVSRRTGARFTYQVTAGKSDGAPHFVALLSGPNNTDDYRFLGTIFSGPNGGSYRHGRKSPIGPEAPSAKAFAWAWAKLAAGEVPSELEVWHEGCCGRCGRALTVPESIEAGLGPECAKRAA